MQWAFSVSLGGHGALEAVVPLRPVPDASVDVVQLLVAVADPAHHRLGKVDLERGESLEHAAEHHLDRRLGYAASESCKRNHGVAARPEFASTGRRGT